MVTDEGLMQDVRGGSRTAFETLFERHRDAVWRFFRRRVADAGRAEELVQDVFVAILQNAKRYEPRAAFRSYLFGIAYNQLLADRRKHRRTETLPARPRVARRQGSGDRHAPRVRRPWLPGDRGPLAHPVKHGALASFSRADGSQGRAGRRRRSGNEGQP